jgi:hypothetical protein
VIDGVGVVDGTQHTLCNCVILFIKCVEEPFVSEMYLTHFSSPFKSAVNISFIVIAEPLNDNGPLTK